MGVTGWSLAIGLLIGIAIALEGWRQSRKLGRPRGERPSLIGVGALELQAMLQPDRKVEILLEQAKRQSREDPAYRAGAPSDEIDPTPDEEPSSR